MQASGLKGLIDALQSPDSSLRASAEKSEASCASQAGYGPALVELILHGDLSSSQRQFAALLLKKFITSHWDRESTTFEEPIVQDGEKEAIRSQIAQGLLFSDGRVRTAIAMAVSAIARWDYPSAWPSLLTDLTKAMESQNSLALVSGSLTCLSMITEDLEEDHIISVVPSLLPTMLAVLKEPAYGLDIQCKAVSTFYSVAQICLDAVSLSHKEAQNLLGPHMNSWCSQFCHIIAQPATQNAAELFKLKSEVLKTLILLFRSMEKLFQQIVPTTLGRCFTAFSDSLPLYQQLVVLERSESAEQAGGECAEELTELVINLFDVFTWVASSKSFRQCLKGNLPELAQMALAYLQVTHEEEQDWLADVNQMLNDEDDLSYTVRSTARAFLDELIDRFLKDMLQFFASNLPTWFAGANEMKEQGDQNFWRLKEAALFAIDSLATELSSHPALNDFLEHTNIVDHLVAELNSASPPLLAARALVVAAKFVANLNGKQDQVIQSIIGFLAEGQPELLQVTACKALSQVCATLAPETMRPYLQPAYQGVTALLAVLKEEALQEVLEAVKALIRLDPASAIQWQPHLTPPVLSIWAVNFNEPCTVMDCVEVFEELASVPEIIPVLQATVVPVLKSIISKGTASNHTVLIEAAIDLATTLMRDSPSEGLQMMHMALSDHVLRLMCSCDDPGILQSSCEYLRVLLCEGGEPLLSQGGADPSEAVAQILGVLQRLLQPSLGDSAPLYIGQVVNALIRQCPSHTLKHMSAILPAVVQKLAEAKSTPLIINLLSVICELVLVDANQLINLLASYSEPVALEIVLRTWTERHADFSTRDQLRLSCAALAAILATRHAALMNIQVKFKRLDLGSAMRTRSQAKQSQEVWQDVAAPVKIAALLADTLLESKEEEALSCDSGSDETSATQEDAFVTVKAQRYSEKVPDLQIGGIPADILKAAMEEGETSGRSCEQEDGPLAGRSVPEVIAVQLKALAQQDQKFLENCCQPLAEAQIRALQECCLA